MIDTPAVPFDVAARFVATIERRRIPLAALFTAIGASLLGRQVATVAIPWATYVATGSLAQTGLTATCLVFPWLLTDPTGNAVATRIGHKPASIAASILGSVMIAAIPLLDLAARLPLASLLLFSVVFAYITALGSVSRHALMPEAADLAGGSPGRASGAMRIAARMTITAGSLLAVLGITQIGQDRTLGIAATLIAIAAAADLLLVSPNTTVLTAARRCTAILSATSTQRSAGTLDRS